MTTTRTDEITLTIHIPDGRPPYIPAFVEELAATLNQGVEDPDQWVTVEVRSGRYTGFTANGGAAHPLEADSKTGRLRW